MNHLPVLKLARAGVIAALYTVLCLALSWAAFGPVQIRVSEALTLLVILCPEAIAGVTIGCLVSNIIGTALGTAFAVDIVVGTLTTLLAAFASYALRGRRIKGLAIPASLPPVLFNAVVVGIELTVLLTPGAPLGVYAFNMLTVGAGQLISCCVLGVLLVRAIETRPALRRMLGG